MTTTTDTDVRMRKCTTSSCGIVYTMPAKGTPVAIECYDKGGAVPGTSDNIWYRSETQDPNHPSQFLGYVAGYYLDTGHDPSHVGAC